ncbi:MAG TPA: transposase [Dermatophilaceae bacterium]|nr:transposase [Dermatophilaceae bacterium]
MRAGDERPTDRQRDRLTDAFTARDEPSRSRFAWLCARQVRSVYHPDTPAAGKAIAETILNSFTTCPIPEVARLGRTLKQWSEAFLATSHARPAAASPRRISPSWSRSTRRSRSPPPSSRPSSWPAVHT